MPKRLAYAGVAFGALILIGLLSAFFAEEEPGLASGPSAASRAPLSAPSRPRGEAPPQVRVTPQATKSAKAAPAAASSPEPLTSSSRRRRARAQTKRPQVTLSGVVVGPRGQPVADARVQARGRRGGAEAKTDALGRFRLVLRAREAWLSARPPAGAPGLAAGEGLRWRAPEAQEGAPEASFALPEPLRLSQGVALVGQVRSLSGEPIPGARVQAWGRQNRARGEVDAQGAFRLEGLSEAAYTVEAKAPGFVSESLQVPVTLERGGEVDFALSPAGSLSGVVRGADGQPAARASVFAFREGEQLRQTTCDRQGSYRLADLAPGPVEVFVRSRDRSLTGRVATRVRVGVASSLDLNLDAGARIRGVLRDSEGKDLAKWEVRVRNASGQVRRRGQSDEDGNYEVKDLYPGTYTITARPPGGRGDLVEEEVEVTSGVLRHDLRAIAGASLSGRVVDEEGKPVRAEVHALQGEDTLGYARCDAEGTFTLENLEPGSYALFLRRRSRQEGELVGRHELEVRAGERRGDLELNVYRPAVIRGRVSGLQADDLAGLRVRAVSLQGSVNRRAVTKADGAFELSPCYDGEYELSLDTSRLSLVARDLGVPGLRVDPVRVRIEGGRDQEVALRVKVAARGSE